MPNTETPPCMCETQANSKRKRGRITRLQNPPKRQACQSPPPTSGAALGEPLLRGAVHVVIHGVSEAVVAPRRALRWQAVLGRRARPGARGRPLIGLRTLTACQHVVTLLATRWTGRAEVKAWQGCSKAGCSSDQSSRQALKLILLWDSMLPKTSGRRQRRGSPGSSSRTLGRRSWSGSWPLPPRHSPGEVGTQQSWPPCRAGTWHYTQVRRSGLHAWPAERGAPSQRDSAFEKACHLLETGQRHGTESVSCWELATGYKHQCGCKSTGSQAPSSVHVLVRVCGTEVLASLARHRALCSECDCAGAVL